MFDAQRKTACFVPTKAGMATGGWGSDPAASCGTLDTLPQNWGGLLKITLSSRILRQSRACTNDYAERHDLPSQQGHREARRR